MTPDELAAIRRHAEHGITQDAANVRRLLAHIDATTAAVERLTPTRKVGNDYDLDRAAVLALLRGTPQR